MPESSPPVDRVRVKPAPTSILFTAVRPYLQTICRFYLIRDPKCEDFCHYMLPKLDEYERLLTDNPIFRQRVEGVATVSRKDAIG